jgi:hypothetical protein
MHYSDLVVYLFIVLTLAVIGRLLWKFWVLSYADARIERALFDAASQPRP